MFGLMNLISRMKDFVRYRGSAHSHVLSDLEKRQVLLVGDELKPHRREVPDLEELLAFLHVLAFIDVTLHHRAGDRRENVDEDVGFRALMRLRDLILAQSELLPDAFAQPVEHRARSLSIRDLVFANRGEQILAVKRGNRLACLDFGAFVIDEELLDSAAGIGAQNAMLRIVVVDHSGDAQCARERLPTNFDRLDAGDIRCTVRQHDNVGCRSATGLAHLHKPVPIPFHKRCTFPACPISPTDASGSGSRIFRLSDVAVARHDRVESEPPGTRREDNRKN